MTSNMVAALEQGASGALGNGWRFGRFLAAMPFNRESIPSVIAHCQAGALGIVAAADLLEALLREDNLVYEMAISPRLVGFDPSNRDEIGGNWHDVHDLLGAIHIAGWSDKATTHAMCLEVGDASGAVEKFNKLLTDNVP